MDWSLITRRGRGEGGEGYKMGKSLVPKLFTPPLPQDGVKLVVSPRLKSGNFLCHPYNMAKTSSYVEKTTPKLFVPPPPPFSMAKTFSALPFHRGKTSRAPPSRFVAPPPPRN